MSETTKSNLKTVCFFPRNLKEHIYEEVDAEHIYEILDSIEELGVKPSQVTGLRPLEVQKGQRSQVVTELSHKVLPITCPMKDPIKEPEAQTPSRKRSKNQVKTDSLMANSQSTASNKPDSSLQEKHSSLRHPFPKSTKKQNYEAQHLKKLNRASEVKAQTAIHNSEVTTDGSALKGRGTPAPTSMESETKPVTPDCHEIYHSMSKKLPPNLPVPNLRSPRSLESLLENKPAESNLEETGNTEEGGEGDGDQDRPSIPPRLYLLDLDFTRELEKTSGTMEREVKLREGTSTRKKPITHRPRSSLISSRGTSVRVSTTNTSGSHPDALRCCNTSSRPTASSNTKSSMQSMATEPQPHYQPLVSRTVDDEEYTKVRHTWGAYLGSREKLNQYSLQSQEEYSNVQHSRGAKLSSGELLAKHCAVPSKSEEQYMEVITAKHRIPERARKGTRSYYMHGESVSSSHPACKYEQEYAEVKEKTVQERLREIKHAEGKDSKGDLNTQLRARLENLFVSKLQLENPCEESKVRYI